MSVEDLICPFCFSIFPAGTLDPEVPVCRECNTFGRAIIVESLDDFVKNTQRKQVEAIRDSWLSRSQFLEDERSLILENIGLFLQKYHSSAA